MQVRHEMTDKIRRMRPTFYFLGLLIGLSATLAAFRWEVTTEIVKIPIEIVDSAEVIEILPFKIIEEKNPEKTTKTKLLPPDPTEFKITNRETKTDTTIYKPFEPNIDSFYVVKPPERQYLDTFKDPFEIGVLEHNPAFPGGDEELHKFIRGNYLVPPTVTEFATGNISLVIKCIVEKDGSLSNFSVLKDGGYPEAAEALITTMKKSPRWSPGYQGPFPVRVYVAIPMKIKMK